MSLTSRLANMSNRQKQEHRNRGWKILRWRGGGGSSGWRGLPPPKSDQLNIFPASSAEIVWRTWLSLAYSDESWLLYTTNSHYLTYTFLVGRMYFNFELSGRERIKRVQKSEHYSNVPQAQPTVTPGHSLPPLISLLKKNMSKTEWFNWLCSTVGNLRHYPMVRTFNSVTVGILHY